MSVRAEKTVRDLFSSVGITIGGPNPWDIIVHDVRFYSRVLSDGSLGLGESYMDGWWDCERLDVFVTKVLQNGIEDKVKKNWPAILDALFSRLINRQSRSRAFEVGRAHYDIGNDLYQAMLDKRMVYTCGYWNEAQTLDEAQDAKLDLVCRKIGLKAGDRVLDIGCGWGSFAKFAAEKYGASVVGVTVSQEQAKLARERCTGLPVEFRLQDYREVNEPFDHVISLGMFEHVGYKNYRTYMEVARRCLKDDGLFLLHTIGGNCSATSIEPWLDKYIFPNAMLPSVAQIAQATEGLFVLEDWHSFGADYDTTLLAWNENAERHWEALKGHAPRSLGEGGKYDERFHRMWRYYLLVCAGTFRARKNQLWQIVFSKNGVEGGYRSVR